MVDSIIHASADRHRKSVLRTSRASGNTLPRMRPAEKSFDERRNTSVAVVRNPGTKDIRGECSIHASPQNISVVISAEISHRAQPVLDVIRERRASAV